MRIAVARPDDVVACAGVLAEAFADDPIMREIWPDAAARYRALPTYFAASIAHHHLAGGAVTMAYDERGQLVAVADWDPPGRYRQALSDTVRAAPQLVWALRGRIRAGVAVRRQLDEHAPNGQFWYLAHIGSLESVRGRGYADALIRHQLDQVDKGHSPAYLVCTRNETTQFYRRFGFADLDQIVLPGGAVVSGMWRPGRPG